jgi:hypothetical protein
MFRNAGDNSRGSLFEENGVDNVRLSYTIRQSNIGSLDLFCSQQFAVLSMARRTERTGAMLAKWLRGDER